MTFYLLDDSGNRLVDDIGNYISFEMGFFATPLQFRFHS